MAQTETARTARGDVAQTETARPACASGVSGGKDMWTLRVGRETERDALRYRLLSTLCGLLSFGYWSRSIGELVRLGERVALSVETRAGETVKGLWAVEVVEPG